MSPTPAIPPVLRPALGPVIGPTQTTQAEANKAPTISLSPPTIQPGLNAPATKTSNPAQQFEAVLLTQLLKGMRRTVPQASESSTARDLYHELHDELMASHLARNGGIGIAAIIQAYLDRTPGSTGGGQK